MELIKSPALTKIYLNPSGKCRQWHREHNIFFLNLCVRKLSSLPELSQGGNMARKAENETVNLMNYSTDLNKFLPRNMIEKTKQTLHTRLQSTHILFESG